MTTNLPDLSTWHRVPIGAKIHAWAPVAIGETVVIQ